MQAKTMKLLIDFMGYCTTHPQQRFWQALRNWCEAYKVEADGEDTFYWEGKRKE